MTDPRLARIADRHRKYVTHGGMTDGSCVECERPWPCPTYRWATLDMAHADVNCTWDLDECEFEGDMFTTVHDHRAETGWEA